MIVWKWKFITGTREEIREMARDRAPFSAELCVRSRGLKKAPQGNFRSIPLEDGSLAKFAERAENWNATSKII